MTHDLDTSGLKEALKELIIPSGYLNVRVMDTFTDLVVMNPKTSTSGNIDFISLNAEFLLSFKRNGQYARDYTVTPLMDNFLMQSPVPRIGFLIGQEQTVSLDGDTPIGTCSTINSLQELGEYDGRGEAVTKYPQHYLSGFYHLLNSIPEKLSNRLDQMSTTGHPVRTPEGLINTDINDHTNIMGFYYTTDRSCMGFNPKAFVESAKLILDSMSKVLIPIDDLIPETLVIVEVMTGSFINIATAVFNSETQNYIIDVVTTYNLCQVPESLKAKHGALLIGDVAAQSYRDEVFELIMAEVEAVTPPVVEAPVEVDGVIHFPKSKNLS